MARLATFKQADLARAIKTAKAYDLPVTGYEISRDGTIRILTGAPLATVTDEEAEIAAWLAKQNGQGGSPGRS
jgi:hypothetical protein